MNSRSVPAFLLELVAMVPIVSPEGDEPWNPGTGTFVSPVGVAD